MLISGGRGLLALGALLALVWGLAGSAHAQTITPFLTLDNNGVVGGAYTTAGTISAILSQPTSSGINGIGAPGSSVVYTYAYYVSDGTTGCDMYGALPSGSGSLPSANWAPAVGDVVQITGVWGPYHEIPEMDDLTKIVQTGTATVPAGQSFLPAPQIWTIPEINSDITNNSITNSQNSSVTVLPSNLGGQMVTIKNVKIVGASNGGTTFGTADSPSGASIVDSQGNNMTFYYWPTSYSVANQNLANMTIPSGYVNMTGFVSVYGNSNVPEFSPITITSSNGPPLYWQPAAGSSTWDGATLVWSQTSGQPATNADASNSAATFDDTGLATGSTVSVVGAQSATSVVVSNSGGTYLFTGGTVSTTQGLVKNGAGGLTINNVLLAPATVSAGTLGGNGSIGVTGNSTLYSLTVGGTNGSAYFTPGTTFSTVGEMTVNGTADFSGGGTYVWKLGSTTDNATGTPGTNWDVLNMGKTSLGGGGYVNFSGSAQLDLNFASNCAPTGSDSFWNGFHTWVIAGSAASAPYLGGSIVNGNYPGVGTFSLQGDTSNDLVLKFTPSSSSARNLNWSANGTTGLYDNTSGTSNWNSALCTDGTTAGLSFDSNRPDNLTFGNPNGSGGVAAVSISGNVTVGSLTLNGSGSANYNFVDANVNSNKGYLTIQNGLTANTSGTLQNADVYLGASQTWNVASGTLTVGTPLRIDYLTQTTVSTFTKSGSGTLLLWSDANYSGGTVIAGGAISVQRNNGFQSSIGALTMAPGTLLMLNNHNVEFGSLSGSGTIDVGSNASGSGDLILEGGASSTYSGVISDTFGTGAFVDSNVATVTLAGANTFSGSVAVNGGGELLVTTDAGLGKSSNPVSIDSNSALGAIASFSSSRAIYLGASTSGTSAEVLDVVGSSTVLTLTGPITAGNANYQCTLTVNNPNRAEGTAGMLVLAQSNNNLANCAAVALSFGTLSVNSPACLGSTPIDFLGMHDGSTFLFAGAGTYTNNMVFPVIGQKATYLNTDGNNVTLTGDLSPAGNESNYYTVDVHKTGSGTLTFACSQPGPGNMGNLYVDQGAVVFSTSNEFVSAQNDSPFGGTGYTYVSSGASLQLAGAQLGMNADVSANGVPLPTIDLASGSGGTSSVGGMLLGSGSSSWNNGGVEVRLNYGGTGTLSNYGSGSVTIGALTPGDVLTIGNAIHQYDPGSTAAFSGSGNYGGNAVMTGPATYADDPNKLVTIHITGPGVVQLQSGGVTSNATFGGEWSVDSGVLEVGPYPPSTGVWNGPYGQLFNALGFKTLDGQSTGSAGTQTVNGDPDMPNGVTVHSGGMFVVAADQVNYTWNSTYALNTLGGSSEYGVNGTPNYFRNPITLSGGTLAVSGNEVIMSQTYDTLPIESGTTAVTGLFGGSFTVCAGTSTVATYDTLGKTGTRTVELLGGSRVLLYSTAAYAASTTISYSTNWCANSTLNVDGGTASGGVFELLRDAGGVVTVGSNARINIINGATVMVGDTSAFGDAWSATQNSDPYGALYDPVSHNSVNFTGTNGHLIFSRTANIAYGGNISGGIDLTQSGLDVVTLTGTNTYSGGTFVAGGELQIDGADAIDALGNGTNGLYVGDDLSAFGVSVPGFGTAISAGGESAGQELPASGLASPSAVPEPGSLVLLLGAIGCGAVVARRRQRGPDC